MTMTCTRLDGSNDRIVAGIAATLQSWTFGTIGFAFEIMAANGTWQAIGNVHSDTPFSQSQYGLERGDEASNPRMYVTANRGGVSSKSTTAVAQSAPQLNIVTKGTGSVRPRFHRRLQGGAGAGISWVHEDMDTSLANGALTTARVMLFGEWEGVDDANMRLWFGFILKGTAWSDAQCEATWPNNSAGHLGLISGHAVPPNHLWRADGATVVDVMANGGDELSRVGCTLDSTALTGFAVSSSGATDLVVADTAQAQTADSPTLTQTHNLAVADARQAQTADSPALTQAHNLAVSDARQAQVADSPTLTQAHILAAAGARQAQTADSPALTQTHNLVVADTRQTQTADTVALGGAGTLVVADTTQAQTADSPTLTQTHVLVAASTRQTQRASSPTLTQAHNLAVADTSQTQTADVVTLMLGEIVTPASRTLKVRPESRMTTVGAEARTTTVNAEGRRYAIT